MDTRDDDTDTDVEMSDDCSTSSSPPSPPQTVKLNSLIPNLGREDGQRRSRSVLKSYKNVAYHRASSTNIAEIDEELLRHYFHLPLTIVAKKLKVSEGVVKRICRSYGISRWPQRKIKSLDNKIQALKYDQQMIPSASKSRAEQRKRIDTHIIELVRQKNDIMTGTFSEGLQLNSMKHRRIVNIRASSSSSAHQAPVLRKNQ